MGKKSGKSSPDTIFRELFAACAIASQQYGAGVRERFFKRSSPNCVASWRQFGFQAFPVRWRRLSGGQGERRLSTLASCPAFFRRLPEVGWGFGLC